MEDRFYAEVFGEAHPFVTKDGSIKYTPDKSVIASISTKLMTKQVDELVRYVGGPEFLQRALKLGDTPEEKKEMRQLFAEISDIVDHYFEPTKSGNAIVYGRIHFDGTKKSFLREEIGDRPVREFIKTDSSGYPAVTFAMVPHRVVQND